MSKEQDKARILDAVKEYYEKYHKRINSRIKRFKNIFY